MEAYPVFSSGSVAAVHLHPWALMSVCQVSSFCADADGHTLADLESGAELGSHFGSQTARPAQHGNGLTRARAPNSEHTVGTGGPLRTPDRDLRIRWSTPHTLGAQVHGQVD